MLMEKLKMLRKIHSFSQKETAKKLGVHVDVYMKYESGKTAPSLNNLMKLATIFNVTLDELTCFDKDEAKKWL